MRCCFYVQYEARDCFGFVNADLTTKPLRGFRGGEKNDENTNKKRRGVQLYGKGSNFWPKLFLTEGGAP